MFNFKNLFAVKSVATTSEVVSISAPKQEIIEYIEEVETESLWEETEEVTALQFSEAESLVEEAKQLKEGKIKIEIETDAELAEIASAIEAEGADTELLEEAELLFTEAVYEYEEAVKAAAARKRFAERKLAEAKAEAEARKTASRSRIAEMRERLNKVK